MYSHAEFLKRLTTFYKVEKVGRKKYYHRYYPNSNQNPHKLAAAGFVYQGDGDTVRCLTCRVRFMEWTAEDCPITLHKQVMPQCQFVVTHLGCTEAGCQNSQYYCWKGAE